MAVTMKLVRRPRTRQTPAEMRGHITASYNTLATAIIADFDAVVAGWRNRPVFMRVVHVTGVQYYIEIKVDRRTKAGKIFWWVDRGTGLHGPSGATYPIDAVNVEYMTFVVPYIPVTIPPTGLDYNPMAEPRWVKTTHIDHPGIKPRRISARIMKKYKDRKFTGGFYRVTENAYRRAFRRFMKRHR